MNASIHEGSGIQDETQIIGTEGVKEYLAKAYLNQKYKPDSIEDSHCTTKILLPGNDISVNDFVKEYAEVCLEEISDYNYNIMR